MKIRRKIYKWFFLSVVLSIGVSLVTNLPATPGDLVGCILRTALSVVPIILFLEYGVLLRLTRMYKFMESGQLTNRGFVQKDYGHDELTEIAQFMKDQAELVEDRDNQITELRDQMEFLIDDAPILVQRFDSKGIVKFVNNTYAEHFETTKEEIEGSSIFDFVNTKGYNMDLKQDLSMLTSRRPVSQNIYQRKSHRGWLMWINRAIFNPYGSIKEYQTIGIDITEQKEAENRLGFVHDSMTLLTSVDLVNVKPALEELLRNFGRFMDADTVRLAMFDKKKVRLIDSWKRDGSKARHLSQPSLNDPTWWSSKFNTSLYDYLLFKDISRIETPDALNAIKEEGIKKIIVVPVAFNHTYVGLLSLEINSDKDRSWTTVDAVTSRMVGRLVGTVLRPIIQKTSDGIVVDKDIV